MKKVAGFLIRTLIFGAAGLAVIYVINHFAPFESAVGINAFNGLVVGLLGVPGLAALYIAALVL